MAEERITIRVDCSDARFEKDFVGEKLNEFLKSQLDVFFASNNWRPVKSDIHNGEFTYEELVAAGDVYLKFGVAGVLALEE